MREQQNKTENAPNSDMMRLVYLPRRLEKGPESGSKPSAVAPIVRSVEVGALYPGLEERLAGVELQHAHGVAGTYHENCRKWGEALLPLLVDWPTARALNGGRDCCGAFCLDEDELSYDGHFYHFVDTARFQ